MKDVFLSHASKDKEAFVIPFARRLDNAGISYWLDEAEMRWGDKISVRINEGLLNSRFVIVFLTPSFLGRNWTETELSAALTRENDEGRTVVLPIITAKPEILLARYPLLRDKKFLQWTDDPGAIVTELQQVLAQSPKRSELGVELTDPLTGVFNRQWVYAFSAELLENANNRGARLAVIFVDIDGFKIFNDLYGHPFGDDVLVEVAKRIRLSVGESATIARVGGDEFLIIVEMLTHDQVKSTAEAILNSISSPMYLSGKECHVTCGIGVSIYPKDGLDIHELFRTADVAVYRCKERGKSALVFYVPEIDVRGNP